jgi:hypothetical protein
VYVPAPSVTGVFQTAAVQVEHLQYSGDTVVDDVGARVGRAVGVNVMGDLLGVRVVGLKVGELEGVRVVGLTIDGLRVVGRRVGRRVDGLGVGLRVDT